jgi:TniQ
MSAAGGLPRRLGIGVVPAQGESFPSWVDRMAIRIRTGPGWVVRELGIELRPGGVSVVLPASYGVSMSRRDLESVHSATGVAPDAVSAMLLSVYDGTVLDLSSLSRGTVGGHVRQREWGLFRGSRCCPDCVAAADAGWRLWWRLGGAAACPEHRVLLHGQCPWCSLPLRWNSSRLPTRAPYPANALTACVNRHPGSRSVCGFPLAELPVRPVSAEVLEVQDLYLRAAAGQALRLAGKEVAPADWFAEMSQLVALARLAGPQEFPGLDALPGLYAQVWREDHAAEETGRSWLWRAHPPSPELMAALLQALGPVLRASSEPEFRDAASWLISAAYRRRGARNFRVFDPAVLPPFTRRAFLTSQHRGTPKVFLGKFPSPRVAPGTSGPGSRPHPVVREPG